MERTSYWNECMDVRCLAKRINNAEKMHVWKNPADGLNFFWWILTNWKMNLEIKKNAKSDYIVNFNMEYTNYMPNADDIPFGHPSF
jgi:hypothetical protein